MTKKICMECHWWQSSERPPDREMLKILKGNCRLHAPKVMASGGRDFDAEWHTVWPRTDGGDFCGDWSAKDEQ